MPSGAAIRTDARDVVGAASDEEFHGRCESAASREHGIQDVALTSGHIARQPFGVGGRDEGFLVAGHAEESNLSRRNQAGHAFEHAQTSSQDRHHKRAWW
jgi:hypothetical protein